MAGEDTPHSGAADNESFSSAATAADGAHKETTCGSWQRQITICRGDRNPRNNPARPATAVFSETRSTKR
jgi:hypothetical protein